MFVRRRLSDYPAPGLSCGIKCVSLTFLAEREGGSSCKQAEAPAGVTHAGSGESALCRQHRERSERTRLKEEERRDRQKRGRERAPRLTLLQGEMRAQVPAVEARRQVLGSLRQQEAGAREAVAAEEDKERGEVVESALMILIQSEQRKNRKLMKRVARLKRRVCGGPNVRCFHQWCRSLVFSVVRSVGRAARLRALAEYGFH